MGKIYSFFFILSVPRIACPVIRLKYRDSRQAILKLPWQNVYLIVIIHKKLHCPLTKTLTKNIINNRRSK